MSSDLNKYVHGVLGVSRWSLALAVISQDRQVSPHSVTQMPRLRRRLSTNGIQVFSHFLQLQTSKPCVASVHPELLRLGFHGRAAASKPSQVKQAVTGLSRRRDTSFSGIAGCLESGFHHAPLCSSQRNSECNLDNFMPPTLGEQAGEGLFHHH